MAKDMHPNSLKNLKKSKQWQPGESGNPKGRPQKQAMTRVNLYLPDELLARLDKATKNRSAFIRQAIQDKLG